MAHVIYMPRKRKKKISIEDKTELVERAEALGVKKKIWLFTPASKIQELIRQKEALRAKKAKKGKRLVVKKRPYPKAPMPLKDVSKRSLDIINDYVGYINTKKYGQLPQEKIEEMRKDLDNSLKSLLEKRARISDEKVDLISQDIIDRLERGKGQGAYEKLTEAVIGERAVYKKLPSEKKYVRKTVREAAALDEGYLREIATEEKLDEILEAKEEKVAGIRGRKSKEKRQEAEKEARNKILILIKEGVELDEKQLKEITKNPQRYIDKVMTTKLTEEREELIEEFKKCKLTLPELNIAPETVPSRKELKALEGDVKKLRKKELEELKTKIMLLERQFRRHRLQAPELKIPPGILQKEEAKIYKKCLEKMQATLIDKLSSKTPTWRVSKSEK